MEENRVVQLKELFPQISEEVLRCASADEARLPSAIDNLLNMHDIAEDERIASDLAQTFAEVDNTPECTRKPSRYQLYVIDQVTRRTNRASDESSSNDFSNVIIREKSPNLPRRTRRKWWEFGRSKS